MGWSRHILCLNEFYYPDICASAVVAGDHLGRIARLRPDWKITVVAGNRAWANPETTYPERGSHEGVEIVRVARPAMSRASLIRRGLGFLAFGRGAMAAARTLPDVDLVIGTTAPPHGGLIARKIARERECPFIYKVLDLYPDSAAALGRVSEAALLYRGWLAADRRAMRGAAAVVAIAERMRERIGRTRGVEEEKLHAIHDGFDAARLKVEGRNQFRERHNPDGKFVVQYAGNMGLSHPFETILEAARRMGDRGDIVFQFIGDGPQKAALAARLPCNAQLLDFEPAEKLGQVLATADVCLISQDAAMFDKALPYKVYASLAAGRPVVFVGSSRSEIAEWLATSGAGVHVEQGQAERLAGVFRDLQGDPARRAAMGTAARRLFEERFDSRIAVERWVGLIEQVTASAGR